MNLIAGILMTATALGGATLQAEAAPQPTAPAADWDRQAAAQYLDERINLWFERATDLKTGDTQTVCLSCHTVAPYLLARPALRKSMGVSEPTAAELKLRKERLLRIDTYPNHQPLSDPKHGGERSTEAVLNALILACDDRGEMRSQLGEPTRKAFRQLWETQRADGAWDWMNFGQEPDESAEAVYNGAAMAAVAVGTAPGLADAPDQAAYLGPLRAYLNHQFTQQNLYRRTWALLASTRLSGILPPDQRKALITELLQKQNPDGGWSLYKLGPWKWSKATASSGPPGKPDLAQLEKSDGYATGLIAYTLRQAGVTTGDPALKNAFRWLKTNQQQVRAGDYSWKCWRTLSLNEDREHGGSHGGPWKQMLMSDIATAFAVMALCSE
jgi:squalene-hopene/tetraprenyl-beta-curcumene cyclase